MNTLSRAHVCMFMCECVCMSLSSGVGVLEAGRAYRSGREGGRLQLSLQLPTGCEGHWCDSTNYRGRKPALQTFTAAAQLGSAGLNPSSTGHFTPLIPPGWIVFQECRAKMRYYPQRVKWKETLLRLTGCRNQTCLEMTGQTLQWNKKTKQNTATPNIKTVF